MSNFIPKSSLTLVRWEKGRNGSIIGRYSNNKGRVNHASKICLIITLSVLRWTRHLSLNRGDASERCRSNK